MKSKTYNHVTFMSCSLLAQELMKYSVMGNARQGCTDDEFSLQVKRVTRPYDKCIQQLMQCDLPQQPLSLHNYHFIIIGFLSYAIICW